MRPQSLRRLIRWSAVLSLSSAGIVSCESSTAPSAAGYTVVATAPGRRMSAVIIHGDTAFTGRQDGAFTATSIATGKAYWATPVTTPGWTTEHLSDGPGLIYVGDGSSVIAISRADGAIAWRYSDPTVEIVATSNVTNNGKYVAFAQNRGVITVLDALTGKRVWERAVLPNNSLSAVSAPAFCDSLLIYSRLPPTGIPIEGDIVAIGVKASNGDSVWTLRVNKSQGLNDYGGISSASYTNSVLFTTKDGMVLRIRAADGNIEWRTHIPAQSPTDFLTVTVSGGEVVVGSPAKPGVESLDLATGRSNWSVKTSIGSPAFGLGVSSSVVAFTAYGAQLVIVDRSSRSSRYIDAGELKIDGQKVDFLGTPSFAGELLVVSTTVGLVTLRPN